MHSLLQDTMEWRNEKTDKMPINRIILMSCGKYNPPTFMHLRMFERARDHLHTLRTHTVIGGVISPVSESSSNKDLADSTIRCDLLNLATKASDWIRMSTWEIRQMSSKSTKEILEHHQNILDSYISNAIDNNISNEDVEWIPDNVKNNTSQSQIQIKLLCGSDLVESLVTSKLWSEEEITEILEKFGLIVIGKEGVNVYKFIYDSDILSKHLNNIHIVTEWIPNEVNSTRIRRALRRGESVKYLLHNDVIEAIYRKRIYNAANWLSTARCSSRSSTESSASSSRMEEKGRVILMSCGSYNPPTHMHLRMFERARDHLHNLGAYIVVGGVVSPVNDAYGKKELASGTHRCEMLRLALQDSDWIRLSTWEMRQQGWTRTRACLQHHQSILNAVVPNQSDANSNSIDNEDLDWLSENVRNNDSEGQTPIQIKLLCGGDLLESFATPGLWAEEDIAEIVGTYGLIVITREGSNPYKFIYDSDVLSKYLHNIQIVTEWIPNEVSSTRIRRALKRGESVKYLLQDPVIDYVYKYGIYGATRPSTIKLQFASNNSSTDYLDTDEANASLTPSPSDVIMQESTTTTTTTPQVVKNNSYSDESPEENTELAREKFFRSLESSSSMLLQHQHQQQHQFSSARARNELLAFDDMTESELATMCDNTYSEEREDDGLSITYEESSEDLNESSVRNNKDCKVKQTSEDTVSSSRNGSIGFEPLEDSDSQATKFESNLEIDGKYIKSLVNSKKTPKKSSDDRDEEEPEIESTLDTDEAKTVAEKVEPDANEISIFDDDISYIKRFRLIINKPADQTTAQSQHLKGSLDSINLQESKGSSRSTIKSMSKKSKSFESIKRNASTSVYCDARQKSDNTSQFVTALETEERCSACSPDEDSTECDICSSCNLRDSEDAKEPSLSETTEICEICGEPATTTEELLTDSPQTINSRSVPLNLPKAKSTIEINQGSYRRPTVDERYEIDNCGLQDCRLRASLDTCNKPEPLYVNVIPRQQAPIRYIASRDDVAMSRSLSIGGGIKRSSRKTFPKKTTTQEKRRYSSVDNLQNRTLSFRSSEKLSKTRESKFTTSADNIRPARVSRSRSLRRSADNFSSGDNLDEDDEYTRVKIRDTDTIKMILTKHGIKIISQKETVL
ncbi:uncharacterized protein LOC131673650 isoform X2 [Phymastichus coffea]|uniref:uncharacterized protein LOC131673650 isoform X2 n=1 Tax=Phymastichus coffea TaxID=108790 RepID=UPI00273B06B1|nr:uncharacterized protein LOC131673650 isoform X2 [Phymastichus coffea]